MKAQPKAAYGIVPVLVGVAAFLGGPSAASAHGTGAAHRHYERCAGVTVDKNAPVISRASVFVHASQRRVWELHTSINQWQSWIPEITPARKVTGGPLRPGSVFEWSPQTMKVTSTVTAVRPWQCTAWGAPVNGIEGVHLFTFKKVRDGVVVTTEESWAGDVVETDIPGFQAGLDAGLNDWVLRIKETAERAHRTAA